MEDTMKELELLLKELVITQTVFGDKELTISELIKIIKRMKQKNELTRGK
jgi:hypothetical protein